MFALAYDKVTVIPTKIGIPTVRTIVQETGMNGSPNGFLPSESNDSIQQENTIAFVSPRRFGLEMGLREHNGNRS